MNWYIRTICVETSSWFISKRQVKTARLIRSICLRSMNGIIVGSDKAHLLDFPLLMRMWKCENVENPKIAKNFNRFFFTVFFNFRQNTTNRPIRFFPSNIVERICRAFYSSSETKVADTNEHFKTSEIPQMIIIILILTWCSFIIIDALLKCGLMISNLAHSNVGLSFSSQPLVLQWSVALGCLHSLLSKHYFFSHSFAEFPIQTRNQTTTTINTMLMWVWYLNSNREK